MKTPSALLTSIRDTAEEVRADLAAFDAMWPKNGALFAARMRSKPHEYRMLLRGLVREILDERYPPKEGRTE